MSQTAVHPPCPHLPTADAQMSHRCLTDLRSAPRPVFYFTALKYGQYLWQNDHAGRALLAITRGLYTELDVEASILQDWPLPYAAIQWIVAQHPRDDFPGNPRISFQHQATRLRGRQTERRRARAWAAWHVICQAKPTLPGDTAQWIEEPTEAAIYQRLNQHGHPGEAEAWVRVVRSEA